MGGGAGAAAHAGFTQRGGGDAGHGGSIHGATLGVAHGAPLGATHGLSRFITQHDGPPRLELPTNLAIKQIAEYSRVILAMKAATTAEQRILHFHAQHSLRARQDRATRQPDFVAVMPEVAPAAGAPSRGQASSEQEIVKTWVALEDLDPNPETAPQFNFVDILSARGDQTRPVLIAVQKQRQTSGGTGTRAPMVAPAPGDPLGRYFVGSKPCETCHAGLFDEFQLTVMGRTIKSGKVTPQGKMECETCHGPGSAHVNGGGGREKGGIRSFRLNDSRGVDVADYNGVCLTCHEKSDQTYWQGSPHETRGLACVNCHTVMRKVSLHKQLKTEKVMDTCFQCHKDRKAQAQRTSHMPIREDKITCANCHNPHGSPTEKLLKEATINDTCFQCHADKRGPFLFEHPPVRENCLNCHEPHGSNHESLLVVARQRLCQQCHTNPHNQPGLGAATLRYAVGNACQNCHTNIHGSNAPSGSRWHR
ncbi:DmsE family decaheme c-type cytochrome [Rhodopseudomonas sp. BAL398]|uniref:DmsE family decaheme c-type cytochrome n=1 Tax=Rhodopseudomonas sp. BAL398 TaxID=3034676 RepID=UPI0023E31820|nr:DmsE family decaheme c-type cytochrome [Rhodopseudomonas sp. BAL398]MDF3814106.1 DmsE family decaheme c-type cytochrome [Rhodopseudomonas sp. BAL398]